MDASGRQGRAIGNDELTILVQTWVSIGPSIAASGWPRATTGIRSMVRRGRRLKSAMSLKMSGSKLPRQPRRGRSESDRASGTVHVATDRSTEALNRDFAIPPVAGRGAQYPFRSSPHRSP